MFDVQRADQKLSVAIFWALRASNAAVEAAASETVETSVEAVTVEAAASETVETSVDAVTVEAVTVEAAASETVEAAASETVETSVEAATVEAAASETVEALNAVDKALFKLKFPSSRVPARKWWS
jgi:hypothetical protein